MNESVEKIHTSFLLGLRAQNGVLVTFLLFCTALWVQTEVPVVCNHPLNTRTHKPFLRPY